MARLTLSRLRNDFLAKIKLITPGVLDDLRDGPFAAQAAGAEPDDVDAALALWADRWHIAAPWVLDTARRTLKYWQRHPGMRKHLSWAPVVVGPAEPHHRAWKAELLIPLAGWDPAVESRESYLRDAVKRCRAMVTTHCDRVERTAARPASSRLPDRRVAEHVEWTVRYIVLQQTPTSILSRPSLSAGNAVRLAVRRLADDLDLPVAPRRPGRPRRRPTI